ncbi:MAG: hypothetical protein AB8H80_10535 [Planctomycetota bacterium]
MNLPVRIALSLAAVFATTADPARAQGKNILFYGNSYTFLVWGYGVPELVEEIAIQAGQPTPTIVQALIGGSSLQVHANDPAQVAVIGSSLAGGQSWDHVVIQGNSLEATPYFGYTVPGFRSLATQIAGNVRAHSPNATAVMYQTWARAWGSSFYPTSWPEPMAMHQMVRGNYDLAVADINATFGAGTAQKAAVGDAVALLEWDPTWYDPDRSHPTPRMTLLAAMCIYTSIYGQNICAVDPGFAANSSLAQLLTTHGVSEANWNHLAGRADRSAAPAQRRFPGSGDHALLESAIDAEPLTACPTKQIANGTVLDVQLRSMNGVYDAAIGWLLIDFYATGSPPGPSLQYPELQVDVGRMIATPPAMLSTPLALQFQMPFALPGGSFLVQGLIGQASSETGNTVFTTTDAHEFRF